MSNKKIERIATYYDELVSRYGHDPRSCDYGRSTSQKIKFEVLSQATSYKDKSVLDIGCGFADYYDFLTNKFGKVDYHGVDISVSMIEMAKKLHPGIRLDHNNVFENPPAGKYDIVTANGIFYLLGEGAEKIMLEFIAKMYDLANQMIVFNSLSSWAKDQESGEFYADPVRTLLFCKSLSPWVTLRHDYHPRDFTIYLQKQP